MRCVQTCIEKHPHNSLLIPIQNRVLSCAQTLFSIVMFLWTSLALPKGGLEVLARTTWNTFKITKLSTEPLWRITGVGRVLLLKNFWTLPGPNAASPQMPVGKQGGMNTFSSPTKPVQERPRSEMWSDPPTTSSLSDGIAQEEFSTDWRRPNLASTGQAGGNRFHSHTEYGYFRQRG